MRFARRDFKILLACLLGLAGCSQEMPPERIDTTPVSGRVHVGTRPIHGGWIEFMPIEGTVGLLRSAPLGPDGTFSARGVAIGRNLVRIVDPPFPLPSASPDPRIDFRQFTSPIRRDIRPAEPLDIDLLSERVRLAENHARARLLTR